MNTVLTKKKKYVTNGYRTNFNSCPLRDGTKVILTVNLLVFSYRTTPKRTKIKVRTVQSLRRKRST